MKNSNNFPLFLATKYGLKYHKESKHLFFVSLAAKGHEFLVNNNIDEAKEVAKYLKELSKIWKEDVFLLKYYLFESQILQYENKSDISLLKKAVVIAKKNQLVDFELGLRTQIAAEFYLKKKYSQALRQIKKVELITAKFGTQLPMMLELKAKIYWEKDQYKKGTFATFEWIKELSKELNDIPSLFIAIVYLLTVTKSLPEKFTQVQKEEINEEVIRILVYLSKMHHLYKVILDHIHLLFSKPMAMIEPKLIDEITDALLMNSRWTVPEQFLFICRKLYDSLVEIERDEKALDVLEKAIKFATDMKYNKIKNELIIKKVETLNKLFFFEVFNPVTNLSEIRKINLRARDSEKISYVRLLNIEKNRAPCLSYSTILEIIDKAKTTIEIGERTLSIIEGDDVSNRNYFVISFVLDNLQLSLLMKEEFQVDFKDINKLTSSVLPFYRVIGLIDEKTKESVDTLEEISSILSSIQKGIFCPMSEVRIIIPKNQELFPIFQYYNNDCKFTLMKRKFKDMAISLKKKHPFISSSKFQKIFEIDPLTIFDLSLRSSEQLIPFSQLCFDAMLLNVTEEQLEDFFTDFKSLLTKSLDLRLQNEFFYNYAFLHKKYEFIELFSTNSTTEELDEIVTELLNIAEKLGNKEKINESRYYQFLSVMQERIILNNEEKKLLLNLRSELDHHKQLVIDFLTNLENQPLTSLSKLFELVNHKEWSGMDQLLTIFFSHYKDIDFIITELNYKVAKDEKLSVDSIFLMIIIVKKLSLEASKEEHSFLLQFLLSLRDRFLDEAKQLNWQKQHYYTFTQLQSLLLNVGQKIELTEQSSLIDSLSLCDWIDDINSLVSLLVSKIKLLLKNGDYAKAKEFYAYLNQQLLWDWDFTQQPENENLIKEVKKIETTIQNQYLI